ncbi:MAG: DNA-methyltransferase, partial [Candidatus Asgardarchaeia archaeon]
FNDDQLGQESTPEEYVKNVVSIMREVKRTLRKDGAVWFNIGDSYNNNSGFCRATKEWEREGRDKGSADKKAIKHPTIKTKDLIGMPWRVAFALQEDGWYLRCDIVWEKTNPMPDGAKDRPTRGHEYIFLLTKSPKYFYDYYGVLEDTKDQPDGIQGFGANEQHGTFRQDQDRIFEHYGKRNKRSVWRTSVASYKGKHYATYPPALIEPCIKASASNAGCCANCGKPWERKFSKVKIPANNKKGYRLELVPEDFEKACKCDINKIKKCLILDPFNGTGTTGEVAIKHDHNYVGIDTNKEYLKEARKRLTFAKSRKGKKKAHTTKSRRGESATDPTMFYGIEVKTIEEILK